MVRARSSYLRCRRFDSAPRYQVSSVKFTMDFTGLTQVSPRDFMPGPRRHKLLNGIFGIFMCLYAQGIYAQMNLAGLAGGAELYNNVVVREVLRTDTILLENGETVKLIGVRAFGNPARKKKLTRDKYGFVIEEKVNPEVPMEEQAFAFVREWLEGKRVRLEFDTVPKDEDYRSLAYVFLVDGDIFVNAQILQRGFADLQIQAPNLKYAAQLREAYRQGRVYSHGMDE